MPRPRRTTTTRHEPLIAHPNDGESVALEVVEDHLMRKAPVGLEDEVAILEVLVRLLIQVDPQLASREVAQREQVLVRDVVCVGVQLDL